MAAAAPTAGPGPADQSIPIPVNESIQILKTKNLSIFKRVIGRGSFSEVYKAIHRV